MTIAHISKEEVQTPSDVLLMASWAGLCGSGSCFQSHVKETFKDNPTFMPTLIKGIGHLRELGKLKNEELIFKHGAYLRELIVDFSWQVQAKVCESLNIEQYSRHSEGDIPIIPFRGDNWEIMGVLKNNIWHTLLIAGLGDGTSVGATLRYRSWSNMPEMEEPMDMWYSIMSDDYWRMVQISNPTRYQRMCDKLEELWTLCRQFRDNIKGPITELPEIPGLIELIDSMPSPVPIKQLVTERMGLMLNPNKNGTCNYVPTVVVAVDKTVCCGYEGTPRDLDLRLLDYLIHV